MGSFGGVSDLRADGADLIVFACPTSDGFGILLPNFSLADWWTGRLGRLARLVMPRFMGLTVALNERPAHDQIVNSPCGQGLSNRSGAGCWVLGTGY